MSIHLYRLLLRSGHVPREVLVQALQWSLLRRASLVEALLSLDLRWGLPLQRLLSSEGEPADPAWRLASALLMDLPPGLCEQTLSFPFRERAGKVEVVTVCPGDDWIRLEFEAHLRRPVLLFRGELQALLAAANSPLAPRNRKVAGTSLADERQAAHQQSLAAMPRSASPSSLAVSAMAPATRGPLHEEPLPLVRKSRGRPRKKQRIATSPGLGIRGISLPLALAPTSLSALNEATDLRQLCLSAASLLPAPTLCFELRAGSLTWIPGASLAAAVPLRVSLVESSAWATAVEAGSYVGDFYDSPAHAPFYHSFEVDSPVRVERIGGVDQGVLLAMSAEIDPEQASATVHALALAYQRIERALASCRTTR